MSITVTDIPFPVEEKTMSLSQILEKYLTFLQDQENLREIEKIKGKKEENFSLEEIKKLYVSA